MSALDTPLAVVAHAGELRAAEKVARRFYLEDRSKIEIASEMGLSRFRVARLLDLARNAGLVTISIDGAGDIDGELSLAVQDRFQLRDAIVLTTPDTADNATLRHLLGCAAANLLVNTVTEDDVLGFGWARAVLSMVAELSHLAPCPVIQLSGALTRPDVESDSIELVRNVARMNGGTASFFYAPMITANPAAARAVRAQADVAAARAKYDNLTTAVVGVGGWSPPASTLCEAISGTERGAARDDGVYADLSGVLIDKDGRPARTPLTNRIIGISAGYLHAVPNVIAIAYGTEKVGATHAAIEGGYINTLITHASFARALLEQSR
jgi:DNA-binding transcriptional regulator LsrR (DeoR family)